ncbi:MAG: dienelactone hydrolase family protein [Proteobacteria bacterium]|nr:dienelactone hydrolase family protein [Pseudomonadota bacterium]
MGTEITLNAKDGSGSFAGYLAEAGASAREGAPGVVVIQEIFGVNAGIREIADGLAEKGFNALAPDLFWRQEQGIQLTDQSEAEWARAFELFNGFDSAKGVEDVQAAIDYLRGAGSAKVGCTGYCLGGLMSYLTAARTDIDASVGYYGVGIADLLGEAANIKKPLMLHIACEDGFVDKDSQKAMHARLDGNESVTLHDYPKCDHAFARVGGEHYSEANAALANRRTYEFFLKHLS